MDAFLLTIFHNCAFIKGFQFIPKFFLSHKPLETPRRRSRSSSFFGLRHVLSRFLKKGEIIVISEKKKKKHWTSLSVSHWSTNMLKRETEAYTGSGVLPSNDFPTILLLQLFHYMWHTQNYSFSWPFYHLISPKFYLYHLYCYFKCFMSSCCSSTSNLR